MFSVLGDCFSEAQHRVIVSCSWFRYDVSIFRRKVMETREGFEMPQDGVRVYPNTSGRGHLPNGSLSYMVIARQVVLVNRWEETNILILMQPWCWKRFDFINARRNHLSASDKNWMGSQTFMTAWPHERERIGEKILWDVAEVIFERSFRVSAGC